MTTLYICGPISGFPGKNLQTFNQAQTLLVERGYTVLNPARHEIPGGTWQQYMRLGLADVLAADGLALLPDYAASAGAAGEIYVARLLGLLTLPLYVWLQHNPLQGEDRDHAE